MSKRQMFMARTLAIAFTALAFLGLAGASPALAGETVTYFHNDIAGTPLVATDEAGNVVWKESYLPYGERLVKEDDSGDNRVWFTGKPHDETTGLSYFGARYYDPVLGRFMGVDPTGVEAGDYHSFNRYAYANSNPYIYIDPDGKMPVFIEAFRRGQSLDAALQRSQSFDAGLTIGAAGAAGVAAAPALAAVAPEMAASGGRLIMRGAIGKVFRDGSTGAADVRQRNIEALRAWAQNRGWIKRPGDGPEVWGETGPGGSFSWRLKIKPEASQREGLGAGSQQPRFDARLDDKGTYTNPFTGQTGGRDVGTHLPLDKVW